MLTKSNNDIYLKIKSFCAKVQLIPKPITVLIFAALGLLAWQNPSSTNSTRKHLDVGEPFTADTYIPKGHTLIPIEVANYESLDSIIGTHGVVDLFAAALSPNDKSKRIAFAVKILRAPRNPSHFAVLVPHAKADMILRYPGPFMVTVRNPKSIGTQFVNKKAERPQRVTYD
ncbi:MAG: hypothetical protein KDD33_08640 [Bdellovibrionales bacterium]|nr:hypothetical protein [Bdellovibrionales bacterium]